jgi:lipoyl(octanoyl) transferase
MSDSASTWFHHDTALGAPTWNMAVDEALLEFAATHGAPVLRFYGWTEPAGTFGYSQRISDVEAVTGLRPLIRRCTGGGFVPHDRDWTYSLAVPPGHAWYGFSAEESYRRIHEWLRDGFARIGVETALSPCCVKEIPGQCFIGAEKHDLLWNGRKIAGAAQRRNKLGLLIQGSAQPPPIGLERAAWQEAMLAVGSDFFGQVAGAFIRSDGFDARVHELAATKYSLDSHNRKRA